MNATKRMPVAAIGAAVFAMTAGGLLQPAVSSAEKVWDIQAYDTCVNAADKRFVNGQTNWETYQDELVFCCTMSGGEVSKKQGCTAPATFQTQPQTPGSVVAPRPGKAALP